MSAVHQYSGAYRRVYVWEFPVRAFHWINAAAITLLVITGFLIGDPMNLWVSREASGQYVYGTIRAVHFISAYVFTINLMVRVYWSLVGNRYARWDTFIPTTKKQFDELKEVVLVDVVQTVPEGKVSLGHNAMASLVYFFFFVASLFQIVTGFGLFSVTSESWFPWLFSWIIPLMQGEYHVRLWHHIMMWFYILFTMVHIYLTFYHDYVEGRGTVSSMVGGWKFCHQENVILEHEQNR